MERDLPIDWLTLQTTAKPGLSLTDPRSQALHLGCPCGWQNACTQAAFCSFPRPFAEWVEAKWGPWACACSPLAPVGLEEPGCPPRYARLSSATPDEVASVLSFQQVLSSVLAQCGLHVAEAGQTLHGLGKQSCWGESPEEGRSRILDGRGRVAWAHLTPSLAGGQQHGGEQPLTRLAAPGTLLGWGGLPLVGVGRLSLASTCTQATLI